MLNQVLKHEIRSLFDQILQIQPKNKQNEAIFLQFLHKSKTAKVDLQFSCRKKKRKKKNRAA